MSLSTANTMEAQISQHEKRDAAIVTEYSLADEEGMAADERLGGYKRLRQRLGEIVSLANSLQGMATISLEDAYPTIRVAHQAALAEVVRIVERHLHIQLTRVRTAYHRGEWVEKLKVVVTQ